MKRPASLKLLFVLACVFGGFAALTALLSIKHIATGAWSDFPPEAIATYVLGYVVEALFAGSVCWLITKRRQSARFVGAAYIAYWSAKFLYLSTYVPTSQRSLSSLRAQYDNPGFGLMMENIFSLALVALLLFWAYKVFSSGPVKEYLSNRAQSSTDAPV